MSQHEIAASLTNEEISRYSRHLIMPEVGMAGQKKLKAASVLLIGAGGLGSPLAMYLAAAGIGRIGLIDYDVVDYTNLQRQIIHGAYHVGQIVYLARHFSRDWKSLSIPKGQSAGVSGGYKKL